jgi:hypothetical protein
MASNGAVDSPLQRRLVICNGTVDSPLQSPLEPLQKDVLKVKHNQNKVISRYNGRW